MKLSNVLLKATLVVTLFSCIDTMEGTLGSSKSIEESKARKVFVCRYFAHDDMVVIDDSLRFPVKEIWVEKAWSHGPNSKHESTNIHNNGDFQLQVFFEDSIDLREQGYDGKWFLGTSVELYLRKYGKNALSAYIEQVPTDTIRIPIQREGEFMDNVEKDIIGEQLFFKALDDR